MNMEIKKIKEEKETAEKFLKELKTKTISAENSFNNIRDKRDTTEKQLKAASEALENLSGGDQANLRSSLYGLYIQHLTNLQLFRSLADFTAIKQQIDRKRSELQEIEFKISDQNKQIQ